MNYQLAIATPHIGAQSETFVRRHIENLHPEKTVVLADNATTPYGGYWSTDAPQIITNQIYPETVFQKIKRSFEKKIYPSQVCSLTKNKVREFIRNYGVEVILGEYLNYSFHFFEMTRSLDIPYFVHGHGRDVSEYLKYPDWQKKYRAYQQAQGVITINQVSVNRLVELGIAPDKIHVIPCGVDVRPQPITRQEQESIRCLSVGRMVRKKAPLLLLESFRLAFSHQPNLRLDCIGGGELFSEAERFVKEHELEQVVTLHGAQPSDFVKSKLETSDIFLQHSIVDPVSGDEEGLPVSILEAMSFSLPVVATRHAGIPEAVVDGETGFLVAEQDCRKMADYLVHLSKDSQLRGKMGLAGWQKAKKKHSWEQERQNLLQVIGLESRIPEAGSIKANTSNGL